tara:strand:+ start:147 stop:1595 length:1449 start_codon:yes stop_codon:yes gene_type:complete
MQKLLAFLLNYTRTYFLSQCNLSKALPLFIKGLSIILLISYASTLYQFSDLTIVDDALTTENIHHGWSLLLHSFFSLINIKTVLVLGSVSALALFFLFVPFWLLIINACIYLALMVHFPTFFSFQWDILLIETLLFTSVLFSPFHLKPKGLSIYPYFKLLPLILLMVRLFFHSGVVKLLSNDPLWLGQFVMDVHLFSQPLPHFLSFYLHRLIVSNNLSPFITQLMFVIELIIPFGLLIPAYRRLSAAILIGFQALIILTGNYGFFNFLVMIILCLPLLMSGASSNFSMKHQSKTQILFVIPLFVILIINSLYVIPSPKRLPYLFQDAFTQIRAFNGFGLFARMTQNQTRFNVYLSKDGVLWDPLRLKYYDNDGFPSLVFNQPYHPRIRWQLWFKFIYDHHFPLWYQKLIHVMAQDPSQLSTVVRDASGLSNNYNYVKLCYQDIVFLLNDTSDSSQYWRPLLNRRCHIYNVQMKVFSPIKTSP